MSCLHANEISITSDHLTVQDGGECVIMNFSDSARMYNDNLDLFSDSICVSLYNDDNLMSGNNDIQSIKEVVANGHARFKTNTHDGNADCITMIPAKNIIILEGNATICDPTQGTIHSEKLSFDNTNGKIISNTPTGTKRSSITLETVQQRSEKNQ